MPIMLINQNALNTALAPESVHCVVTSPPYMGLRNYAARNQLGQEPVHDCLGWASGHVEAGAIISFMLKQIREISQDNWGYAPSRDYLIETLELAIQALNKPSESCGACFVCNVRKWSREIWRVLRPDGTLWLNIGDSYNGSGGAGGDYGPKGKRAGQPKYEGRHIKTLKPKDQMGIPWRVALALQADGWYLRKSIIWHKPNGQPESATDRPSRAHEYIFLFAKSEKYFFDMEPVRTKLAFPPKARQFVTKLPEIYGKESLPGNMKPGVKWQDNPAGSHIRDVWKQPVGRYAGSHYATYPPKLIEPCILAGTSAHGVCFKCGAPWRRVIKRVFKGIYNDQEAKKQRIRNLTTGGVEKVTLGRTEHIERQTAGWLPTCNCYRTRNLKKRARQDLQNDWTPRALEGYAPVKPAIVYDPFIGSGTTLEVARHLGRSGIGGDLSYQYLTQEAKYRLGIAQTENWQAGKAKKQKPAQDGPELQPLPLFAGIK